MFSQKCGELKGHFVYCWFVFVAPCTLKQLHKEEMHYSYRE